MARFLARCALAVCLATIAAASASAAHGKNSSGGQKKEASRKRYDANWGSLMTRPLPTWFDEAKFGIFIHWGVFSVPAYENEWYWWWLNGTDPEHEWFAPNHKSVVKFQRDTYGEGFQYQDFAKSFQAKLFDPDQWAELFKSAGARYVVLTSKHHEGFTMWPSKYSWNWNAMDVGPHRDLVGELTKAVKAKNLTMGLYHSMFEWFHPLYLQDKRNNFTTRNFVTSKTMPELREIVTNYKPDVIWSDGEWDAPSESYWGSPEFLAWLYNDSPVRDTVVTNDRWGKETRMKLGGYFSGEDRQQAGAELLGHKWENCMTVDRWSWGYNRVNPIDTYLNATEILQELISTVAFGGNLLLNVGPTADGLILPIFQERLKQVGDFLKINGEAVYGTRPCSIVQQETGIDDAYYTMQNETLYLTVVPKTGFWPKPGTPLDLRSVTSAKSVRLLTANGPMAVECTNTNNHVQCTMPSAYDAGLTSGAVNQRGFSLRLKKAVVEKPGMDMSPFV